MFKLYTLLFMVACSNILVHAAQPIVDVSFPKTQPADANIVRDNFLGISIELSSFNTLWGNDTSSIPNAMQNYLSNIRSRMSNPLRIRIGGDSMDSSTYIPTQSEEIIITNPNAYFNDIPTTWGPSLFDVMNAMADKVGEIAFIITLSMQVPGNWSNDILVAEAAESKLGSRLDALLAGNEPDLYDDSGAHKTYTIPDYVTEVGEIIANFTSTSQGDLLNKPILGAPTTCCGWNLDDVLNAGLINDSLKYATIQHYPNNVCSGSTPASSNISYYLSHMNVAPFISWNEAGLKIAQNHSVPALLTEYNSASCGGDPAVGPTFAASLWAIDVALSGAGLPFAGVYLHTREFNITYNLFNPPSPTTSTSTGWKTGAVYYSELVVAESLSNHSVVVDLNLNNSTTNPAATVAGYGIYDNGTRGKLVFINFANNTDVGGNGANASTRAFVVPANISSLIGVRYLLAPTVNEQHNISWAGQTVGDNGNLLGNQTLDVLPCKDGCSIDVPGPGLALVFLDPANQTYVGNSTMAGTSSTSSSNTTVTNAALSSRLSKVPDIYSLHGIFSILIYTAFISMI